VRGDVVTEVLDVPQVTWRSWRQAAGSVADLGALVPLGAAKVLVASFKGMPAGHGAVGTTAHYSFGGLLAHLVLDRVRRGRA